MREDLLGYLLGALEPEEEKQVAAAIEGNPDLWHELQVLRSKLGILEQNDDIEPPHGLMEKTIDFVFEQTHGPQIQPIVAEAIQQTEAVIQRTEGEDEQLVTPRPAMGGRVEAPNTRSWWSLSDAIVGFGICVAGALLFLPIIANSRADSQRNVCAENLSYLGLALQQYSERSNGYFPAVHEHRNAAAGNYAPLLFGLGFVDLPSRFICPGSVDQNPWAEQWKPPTMSQIQTASSRQLGQLQSQMGGTYGYQLGYVDQHDVYRAPRNLSRSHFAIMADMPDATQSSSQNHGEGGYNALFEDGHVEFRTGPGDSSLLDIFRSDRGRVEPGRHLDDAVIVTSNTSPF